jgi:predicted amidophosphoribosyltransferase
MVRLYCRDFHNSQDVCADCSALLAYARKRLEVCPFQALKPTCSKCHIHCYKPDMREKVTTVMRYAGPRMIRHHPLMALQHVLDRFRAPKNHREPR